MSDRTALDPSGAFASRHIGPGDDDQAAMLDALGYGSLEELVDDAVPASIREAAPLDLPAPVSEAEALARLRDLAGRNQVLTSMIGLGYHDTVTPPVIRRSILENPAWYTAYTPYQPEISQGRLEALLNFQTLVTDLAGLALANSSLLDEATAAAEALTLSRRASKAPAGAPFVVDTACHPQTLAVVRTRAEPLGIPVVEADLGAGLPEGDLFGVLVQYPTTTGLVRDDADLVAAAHERGALVTVAADPLALCVLRAPGEIGADVVVGSAQRFGVPMGFGGPHAGYMAVRDGLQRSLPGRLVGVSIDADGDPALRLALQTREQHIRREKATSNICTAQVLLAVIASSYAVYHGPDGLTAIAERVHRAARTLDRGLRAAGVEVVHDNYFDTVCARVPGRADEVVAAALAAGVNLRRVDEDHVAASVDEVTTAAHLDAVLDAFGAEADAAGLGAELDDAPAVAAGLARTTPFCTHPVFSSHHSETAMLRYLRRLADRDVALDRSMIPLGSCTMKLNAAAEMEPITWPGFAGLHPFAPLDQSEGYRELIADLERWLVEVTGYGAVSLQPNAGSQGELAGLLAIAAYHRSRGDEDRDVCLIPSSAHGTNAASAVMAGMRVVVVACDDQGNVDLDDLRAKVAEAEGAIAALMVTYPSTHGVFEEAIGEICDVVHEAGGQVYLDGANLNAMVGLARPGRFGADVSHLNLHKTFCIPHGGGGPGVGPVAVGSHLAPFLPSHPLVPECGPGDTSPGPVAAAPWGSAGILPIPWAYVRMMGGEGLRRATQVAILNANHVARRLADHYPVLYAGRNGLVAHECILDIRPLTKATGITVDDIAKRLIDHGFHAPTMSFPVAGTLMVEPTESEDRAELDRFCDALIAIREEVDTQPDLLRGAPWTASAVLADEWEHPFTRAEAAFPGTVSRADKYWPPVRRIDGGHGDRNLVCSCPPMEELVDQQP
ncbi:aminomethyl-transferring glycine dehydrogenase [Iamia majanohamensis]|uniref:Glycine dehydrogenase (decarboxylating) n=1 Tax=Iamia majanohamensis TaxID=467976 RepID=A0AAF0BSB3_9ACTN|nr:aminomethyl-transferring glycine dehydrogenase [Iamia majanohamensis]WCO65032.1 aminomethyl-transferring glycine dehydrogenase [Iamia majanohamensis]